ncbi:winged helix-turn-helix domain-containing protein [Shewanella xiamenensis]|uniref:nSTAND1 domain-containing NTPase n=1 Tax=Shewanella xiamenensis TaxID=332186 RepID=UPI0024A76D65|nr:winged helix-turn-helix domain-containing protein [Shewanella xiamenensis]MDI5836117.1 winged helix-turn-helix domain-containing protein [Shewanella xiamenensis]MDI5840090.1 winged helix-turn-helix domain-containing protein [Shewanella xiamenensis]MDI5843744.1 winged helix-turn-helix domain-containing protein [Shewanella xiamenensis]MDI5849673.1 winged helix-turn-helix domain-containing protein [Shewanella xiamenensis]MDI5851928.1 winged helix-turn-helix domain-containing protein [Shewanell
MSDSTFFLGEWQVNPSANSLLLGKQVKQLEPKAMDVLLFLCQNAGEVVSSDEIVSHCWPGVDTGDNPLHKIINQLRRALGDSATESRYIETIRKRGYRTLAEVRFPVGHEASATPQTWQGGSPFPGLQAYSANYADVFFGRSEQISTLLNRISQQIQFGRAFCLILGPSGSGKSSLINAGVLPNLMAANGFNGVGVVAYSSLDFADVSKGQLLTDLASAMLDWELNDTPVFEGMSADTLAAKLEQDPQSIADICKQSLKNQTYATPRFGLFIDRLEVLLSSPLFSDAERSAFIELLERLATSHAVLILSACRNDFYPLLVNYPSLMAGKARGAHFDLAPPTRTELLQMIRLPAVAANLTWDIDSDTAMPLDEMLCSDAASNPDALPMLQYTLQALYLQRSDDDKLLVSVYRTLDGIEGAIGKNAEQAISHLTEAEKASLPRILSLLVTLREDEKSITSRTARWSQLQSAAETALVQAMVDSRLFVSHLQNGEPCFSIAHEALLRRWPRATAWISEHNDSLSIKSRLQHLSQRWLSEAKHSAYLLAEGKPLKEAQSLRQNPLFDLDERETDFIAASSKRATMLRWTRRITVALLCVLTLTSVIMSVRSIEAEKLAQQKRLAAEDLLGFMVGDFADKMRGIGRMDLLDGISNKALEYFTDFSSQDDEKYLSFDARFQHGQTLEAMGEVAYSRNKIDEARSALLAAQEKMLPLLELQPDNLALLKTLGANAFWLGQLKYDVSDWAASRPFFEQYLKYSQTMYSLAPEDKDALMELSYAHNTLGSVSMKQLEFAKAQQDFEESLRLKLLALAKAPEDSQLIADVANARSWLASAAVSLGDISTAISIHKELQKELELGNHIKSPYLLEKLSGSYQTLADLLSYTEHKDEALNQAKLNLSTVEEILRQDPKNDIWKTLRYYSIFQVIRLSNSTTDKTPENKISVLEASMLADTSLSKIQKKSEIWASFYLSSSYLLMNSGNYKDAKTYAEKAYESYLTLSKDFSQNMTFELNLAESELLISESNEYSLEINNSFCSKANERIKKLMELSREPKYKLLFERSINCIHLQ